MGELSPRTQTSEKPSAERLDSWKEIAAYLNRDVTTVQRWEKREGMPVHRHVHDKRGSVYALTPELDAWLQSRRPHLYEEEREYAAQAPVDTGGDHERRAMPPARLWLALAGVVVLAVIAVAYIMMSRGRADNAAHPQIKSLAVLPLKNLSGDPAQDYLADGMTEALIGRLAHVHDLRVISHTSVMRFKNPQISVPQIARTLNVDAIVEGSVMRDGNRIRVTAQLIRGATDEHFWSETYDRELQDVLALQSDVAQSIADKVQVTVTGEEHQRLAAARPVAPEVYESYLQGWYELNKGYNKADIEKSIAYFQNAINADPTFAPAYVGLASGYSALGSNFVGDPHDPALQKEMSAAQKAVELDPNLADAHVLLGDVQKERWQWADAQAEYRRALELNPHSSDAYADLAWWFLCQGRTDEALASMRRARELDPLSVDATDMGWMLFEARRYDEAMHELRSVLEVNPNDSVALWDLGIALIDKNQPQDAIPVLEKALPISDRSPGVIGTLIRAYAQAGRRGDAIRLLAELKARSKAGSVPASAFVNAYLGLGETDQAFAWLEQAYKEHSNILQFLKVDPAFDSIRGDPRFADLARRVGLG
jgi:TolB-like protein/Tfp pilus assembly protein PilF